MRKVLIVDDEPFIAMEMEDAVLAAGFGIDCVVHTVAQALHAIEQSSCDLAVIDANLRGESSEAVARRLCELGKRFIVVSGYSASHITWIGDAPFLEKPFDYERLTQMLRSLAT